jgi:hypothetical protein
MIKYQNDYYIIGLLDIQRTYKILFHVYLIWHKANAKFMLNDPEQAMLGSECLLSLSMCVLYDSYAMAALVS